MPTQGEGQKIEEKQVRTKDHGQPDLEAPGKRDCMVISRPPYIAS
jgi:hypothetical protein